MRSRILTAVLVTANLAVGIGALSTEAQAAEQWFRDCCEKLNGTANTYVCIDDGCIFTNDCTTNADCERTTLP